jgi:quinol monooxygenase YgiN
MLAEAFLEEVSNMHIVIVSIHVKDDRAGDFLTMTQRNVRETLKEPGVRRFDFLRESVEPTRFLLIEVYDTVEDHTLHKATAHYRRWAEEVEPVLASPRSRTLYESCLPHESGWE